MEKFVIRKIDYSNFPYVIVNYSFTGDKRQLQMELNVKDETIERFIIRSLSKLYRIDEVQMTYKGTCYRLINNEITSFKLYRR